MGNVLIIILLVIDVTRLSRSILWKKKLKGNNNDYRSIINGCVNNKLLMYQNIIY